MNLVLKPDGQSTTKAAWQKTMTQHPLLQRHWPWLWRVGSFVIGVILVGIGLLTYGFQEYAAKPGQVVKTTELMEAYSWIVCATPFFVLPFTRNWSALLISVLTPIILILVALGI